MLGLTMHRNPGVGAPAPYILATHMYTTCNQIVHDYQSTLGETFYTMPPAYALTNPHGQNILRPNVCISSLLL